MFGFLPTLLRHQHAGFKQSHRRVGCAHSLFELPNGELNFLNPVLLQEHIGKQQQQRSPIGHFLDSFLEHFNGSSGLLLLHGQHSRASHHPLVVRKELHPLLDKLACLSEVFLRESNFKGSEHRFRIVWCQLRCPCNILACALQITVLPVPACQSKPCLGVSCIRLHKLIKHAGRGRRVVHFLFENGCQDDEDFGAVWWERVLGIKRFGR